MPRLKSNFQSNSQTLEVFFSYAHEDEDLRNELAKHLSILQRHGIIDAWYDRDINAGAEWSEEIDTHLNSAQIILLLISPDFIASDYCFDIEMKRAMERYINGEAVVIPIILRPTDWSGTAFRKLQALPKDAKPVTNWANRDEAFFNIAQGIRKTVKSLITTTNSTTIDQTILSHENNKPNNNMSIVHNSLNQRKIKRIQKNIELAEQEHEIISRKMAVIIDRLDTVIDAEEKDSLKRRKLEREKELNLIEEKIDKLYLNIEKIR